MPLTQLRNFNLLIFLFPIVFVVVKLNFKQDLGDYILGSLTTFYIYLTSYLLINHSVLFKVESAGAEIKKSTKSHLFLMIMGEQFCKNCNPT